MQFIFFAQSPFQMKCLKHLHYFLKKNLLTYYTQVVTLYIDKKKCANQIKHKFMNKDLHGLDFHENVKKAQVLFEIAPICSTFQMLQTFVTSKNYYIPSYLKKDQSFFNISMKINSRDVLVDEFMLGLVCTFFFYQYMLSPLVITIQSLVLTILDWKKSKYLFYLLF